MKKPKFTEEQIAFALRQVNTGTKVAEVCRKIGIAEATFYNWKKIACRACETVFTLFGNDISERKTVFHYFKRVEVNSPHGPTPEEKK